MICCVWLATVKGISVEFISISPQSQQSIKALKALFTLVCCVELTFVDGCLTAMLFIVTHRLASRSGVDDYADYAMTHSCARVRMCTRATNDSFHGRLASARVIFLVYPCECMTHVFFQWS